jgi:hypothetical protein
MNGFAIIFLGFVAFGVLHTHVRSVIELKLPNVILMRASRLQASCLGNGSSIQISFSELLLKLLYRLMIITGLITLVTAVFFW